MVETKEHPADYQNTFFDKIRIKLEGNSHLKILETVDDVIIEKFQPEIDGIHPQLQNLPGWVSFIMAAALKSNKVEASIIVAVISANNYGLHIKHLIDLASSKVSSMIFVYVVDDAYVESIEADARIFTQMLANWSVTAIVRKSSYVKTIRATDLFGDFSKLVMEKLYSIIFPLNDGRKEAIELANLEQAQVFVVAFASAATRACRCSLSEFNKLLELIAGICLKFSMDAEGLLKRQKEPVNDAKRLSIAGQYKKIFGEMKQGVVQGLLRFRFQAAFDDAKRQNLENELFYQLIRMARASSSQILPVTTLTGDRLPVSIVAAINNIKARHWLKTLSEYVIWEDPLAVTEIDNISAEIIKNLLDGLRKTLKNVAFERAEKINFASKDLTVETLKNCVLKIDGSLKEFILLRGDCNDSADTKIICNDVRIDPLRLRRSIVVIQIAISLLRAYPTLIFDSKKHDDTKKSVEKLKASQDIKKN